MGRHFRPKEKFLSVCTPSGQDDGQRGTSHTHHFESTHGRENGQTHFARHRLG